MKKTLQTLAQELTQESEGESLSASDYQVLSTLINAFPDRVFIKDTQLRFVLCNQAMAERCGETTPEAMYHKSALDYYDPVTAESIQAGDTTVLESGTPLFHHEKFIKYPSKKEAWVSTTLIPLRNTSGKIVGLLGLSRDITERKQYQQELETQVTQRTKELKKANEEIIQMNEDLEKRVLERTQQFQNITLDLYKEIDARKSSEKELRESKDRFRELFEKTPVSLWEQDFSKVKAYLEGLKVNKSEDFGQYLDEHPKVMEESIKLMATPSVNQATLNLYKTDNIHKLLACTKETWPKMKDNYKKELTAIWKGQTHLEYEGEIIITTGETLIVNSYWSVLPGREKSFALSLRSLVDITRRKKAETKVARLNEELEQRVELRTAELQGANEALQKSMQTLQETQNQLLIQEKLASLGALTAGISHEIKNPLNFINNYAELFGELLEELKNKISEQKKLYSPDLWDKIESDFDNMQHIAKVINSQGNRVDRIIKSMLMHSGGSKGELRPTDINSLLDEYLNLSYHGMRAKNLSLNIKIESDYDSSLTLLNVIAQDIGRVFLNLIGNALYALKEKADKSTNDYVPILNVSTKNLEDRVEIRIRDNGEGIPKHVQAEIFDPFFTTKPSGQGSGLGLFISYEIIVKAHQGKILLDTEPGEYTEFTIVLKKDLPSSPTFDLK